MALAIAIGVHAQLTVIDTLFDRAANEDFAFGADISWVSQQEKSGTKYRNRSGKQDDLMNILQTEQGINAVRFRVWVNPGGGWSGKDDVIGLCKRAHAKGLKIMIAFHYSDTWADSGSQTIPSAWKDHSVAALEKNIYDHTYDILHSLHLLGIHPKWVGMGNETKYGMLYDVGKTRNTDDHSASEGYQNFTRFINASYKAIKDVDPSMLAIVHLPNGHDEATARSMFNNLNKYGANYDVIGLSAYPRWSHLDITNDSQIKSTINTYMTTFKNLKATFKKPVMVIETGHYVDQPYDANRFLAEFMKALIDDGELGCFYWEPESSGGYNLGAWDGATGQATIAMDAFKGIKHTKVDKYATVLMRAPSDTLISESGKDIELKVYARTTTNVTKVSSVEFFLNGNPVAKLTETTGAGTYAFIPDQLAPGVYQFHALINDNQNHTQVSDTVSFMVGPLTLFQEDTPGFLGITSGEGGVSKKNYGYTGNGYLSATPARNTTASWSVHFPEAGNYLIAFRYVTSATKPMCKILVNDELKLIASFPKTKSLRKWAIESKTLTIEEPGTHTISIAALSADGIPDIDYMALIPLDGSALVETAISNVESNPSTPRITYDLSGKKTTMSNPPRGIYVIDREKYIVR